MRIAVLGANGMLGRAVVEACRAQDVSVVRGIRPLTYNHYVEPGVREFDIENPGDVHRATREVDAVINCVGCVDRTQPLQLVGANALGPHVLAQSFEGPIVHVSTDCVFSGRSDEPYTIHSIPDPLDLYGRSKSCGEVEAPHVLNVRTSFIGFDHGLMYWTIHNSGEIEGWLNAVWSGSTVWAVADQLVKCAVNFRDGGIAHLATLQPINKFQLLSFLAHILNLKLDIKAVQLPVIDRSLEPTIILPSIAECGPDIVDRYSRIEKVATYSD